MYKCAGAYKAVSTVNGVGDHTWNDIQIMTSDEADRLLNHKNKKLLDSYKDIDA